MNLILKTDSYKTSHYLQYPPNTKFVSSYIEARGMSSKAREWFGDSVEIVNFGIKRFLDDYMFHPITADDIADAHTRCKLHGVPFNTEGWLYILEKHHGRLPLRIQSLPEGLVVPLGTPQVQVVGTDGQTPWLTSYIETPLLRAVWYGSTVATISREVKKRIKKYMELTCDNLDGLDYKLHDFGARGASSGETAENGGMAHMLSFLGTDNLEAIDQIYDHYEVADMPGFSIPAAEHSTITAWGRDREAQAYRNMVDQFSKPGSIYAVVSDSYDIYNAVGSIWGGVLHERVINKGGTLVIRPDSGDPNVVVPEVLAILSNRFGYSVNSKGYRILPPYLRVIQGDGMNPASIVSLMATLKESGWSIDNIAFGMGGGLLQNVTRDTFKYAMKASAAHVDGQWVDVFKDPVTDPGKVSKKGIQWVYEDGLEIKHADHCPVLCQGTGCDTQPDNLLQKVWDKQTVYPWLSWEKIKKNASV
jgi:nicotinamide phosphoribosyltransferase